jgi:endonuclease YncB( thermonuclease family)
MKTLLLFLFLSLLPVYQTFNALVIGVYSGDSIVVTLDDSKQLKVRLDGIDCPEIDQPYGDSAKLATVVLCFKKQVSIVKTGVDNYGRTLAYVYVGDICINKELLRLGMAWHYKAYNSDPELAKLETEARDNKVGLWSQPDPEAPWDFRHNKNKKQ